MSEREPTIQEGDKRRADLIARVSRSPVGRLLTPTEWHATTTHAETISNWQRVPGNRRWFQHGPLAAVPNFFESTLVVAANAHEIEALAEEHNGVVAGAFRVGETAVVAATFSPPEDANNPEAAFRIGPGQLDATIGVLNVDEGTFVGAGIVITSGSRVPVGELPQMHPRAVLL